MILARIWEKLTGRPHKKRHAQMVKAAATSLRRDVNALSNNLSSYQDKDDPLVALMLDIFNDREAIRTTKREHDNRRSRGDPR